MPAESNHHIKKLINEEIRNYFNDYPEHTGHKLLDIGCGDQPFRSLIESKGILYKSLDFVQNQLNNVDYIFDFNQPVIPSEKFNLILCTELIEHLSNWDQAFRNFNTLLEKDGRLILTAPFFFPLHEEPIDYWRPTDHTIRYFCEKSGLKISISKRNGDIWDILGTISMLSYLKPLKNSLKNRILFRIIFRIQKILRKKSNIEMLKDNFEFDSGLYMSNYFVAIKINEYQAL